MSSPSEPPLLAPRSPSSAAAAQEKALETWQAVEVALVPIIGQGGFAALYQRCLHLAVAQHPWLSSVGEDGAQVVDFNRLLQALALQPPEQASAAQACLLRSFTAILANLIGPSLVQRLLGSVGGLAPNGLPEQDTRS